MSFLKSIKFAPFYILSLLPFWIIFGLAQISYFLLFVVIGYRKKVVYENLKNSFPHKSELEIHLEANKVAIMQLISSTRLSLRGSRPHESTTVTERQCLRLDQL